ncbi:MAG: hypothetical protein ACYC99_04195 [Candidatus Geothermincolia bacterium]
MGAEKKDGILHQPIGELLKKEITADFLKKDLHVPEALKREIPVGKFLSKEITLKRRKDSVDQVVCFACGRETPATVSRCLHCEATLEAPEPAMVFEEREPSTGYFKESVCLIDMDMDW